MSDLRKTLKEMAQLSVFSNRISEVQEKNLKNFPFVFFENVKLVTIDYDLGHGINEENKEIHHKSHVTYKLTLDESANTIALEKRFLALEASVRAVFWRDVSIKVFFNDKPVFESKNGN